MGWMDDRECGVCPVTPEEGVNLELPDLGVMVEPRDSEVMMADLGSVEGRVSLVRMEGTVI